MLPYQKKPPEITTAKALEVRAVAADKYILNSFHYIDRVTTISRSSKGEQSPLKSIV